MKENIVERYRKGESIPARDFNCPEGLKFFGEVVWMEHGKEHAVAQIGLLDSEVYWQKTKVNADPVKEFLKRPTDVQRQQERVDPEKLLCADDRQRLYFARELLRQEIGK